MKNVAFTGCSILLIIAAAVALIMAGPCDGLTNIGSKVGITWHSAEQNRRATENQRLIDEDVRKETEKKRLREEREAAEKADSETK
jgi:hypothetical protein